MFIFIALAASIVAAKPTRSEAPPSPYTRPVELPRSPGIEVQVAGPGAVRAQTSLELEGAHYNLALIIQGDQAALLIQDSAGRRSLRLIATPDDALSILADRRMARLWPAVQDWAGEDLTRLRAWSLARARLAYERGVPETFAQTTGESASRPRLRSLLQYVGALRASGQADAGVALLRSALSETGRKSDWDRSDRAMLQLRIAGILKDTGRSGEAIKTLEEGERDVRGTPYALNLAVTRAAFLAEAGRYGDALVTVDEAWKTFTGKRRPDLSKPVAGSDRQFAWIRACALHGLGRTEKARTALGNFAEEEPRDPFFMVSSNNIIKLRLFACERDAAGAVSELVPMAAANPLDHLLLHLQPAFAPADEDSRYLHDIQNDLRLKAVTMDWLRPLPTALEPALNHWEKSER